MKNLIHLLAGMLLFPLHQFGADTLRLTLRQADSLFITTNYQLLAANMHIEATQAQVLQAKLFTNPIATVDINVYDPENQRILHTGNSGQKSFQIEQLLRIGGKRKAEIDWAKTQVQIAQLTFEDLIRQLKFQLHSNFYTMSQHRYLLEKYDAQLDMLDTILQAYSMQVQKGNIPLKDVVRLKGVYLNLNNNRAELYHQYLNEMAEVQTLLQTQSIVIPIITDQDLENTIHLIPLEDLQSTALAHRADYLISEQQQIATEQNYRLQKKLALPDVNVFANYDQRSGAFQNQINAGISIPVPLWNRNQGNIQTAKSQVEEARYSHQTLKTDIINRLNNQYTLYNHTVAEYHKARNLYNDDFEFTLRGMTENFQKQNVSVLEFVDFFESYTNSMAEIARIKIQLAVSAEQLNLILGHETF